MTPTARRRLLLAAIALAALSVTGCQFGYLVRQGAGELALIWGATDLESVRDSWKADGEAGLDRVRKLDLVVDVKRFAADQLELDVGDAYTTYYESGDRPVSYAVSAAHPLALVPYRWSFPFVGTVTYKGFFDRDDALAEEARLRAQGWDTTVVPVAAFSTLGWFRDPVLSTMLEEEDGDLAELLIHELVHRTVYFRGRTAVNESLATAVGRAGARRFLELRHGGASESLGRYERGLARQESRRRLLARLRRDLDALYRSNAADAEKLDRKGQILDRAARALARLEGRSEPEVISAIRSNLSNARVLASGQYDVHVPIFERAIAAMAGRPDRLMAFLKGLPASDDPIPVITAVVGESGGAPAEPDASVPAEPPEAPSPQSSSSLEVSES